MCLAVAWSLRTPMSCCHKQTHGTFHQMCPCEAASPAKTIMNTTRSHRCCVSLRMGAPVQQLMPVNKLRHLCGTDARPGLPGLPGAREGAPGQGRGAAPHGGGQIPGPDRRGPRVRRPVAQHPQPHQLCAHSCPGISPSLVLYGWMAGLPPLFELSCTATAHVHACPGLRCSVRQLASSLCRQKALT